MTGKRILLVDDEPEIQMLLAHNLIDEGYAIDIAGGVEEAMALLDAHSYALVICDWRLPDGDGLLVADTAAELGAKTLLMSGHLFQMPGGRALQHETLMKPVRPSEMIDAVVNAIGKASVA